MKYLNKKRIINLCFSSPFVLLFLITGCHTDNNSKKDIENLGRASGAYPFSHGDASVTDPAVYVFNSQRPPAVAAERKIHQGEVVDTIEVKRYVYLQIKKNDGNVVWAAVPTPPQKIKKGQIVKIAQQMLQENFTSNTLKRTFKSLIFGTYVE